MSLNIKPLDKSIHKKLCCTFNCGNARLNSFIKGPEALDLGIGATSVLLSDDESEILGYYNLTTGIIAEAGNPSNRLGGSIHINCFALDNRYHGLLQAVDRNGNNIKLSDIFFRQCMEKIISLREQIGFTFITLSSTKEGYHLYKRAMFDDLEDDMIIAEKEMEQDGCIPMYYSLDLEE